MTWRTLSGTALLMAVLAAPAARASDASYDKVGQRPAAPQKASGCTCAMNRDGAGIERRAIDREGPAREQFRDSYHQDPAKLG